MGEPIRLYVGNLNFRTAGQDLNEFFSQFGPVEDAVVIMERDDPTRSRGFGFVTYATMELAQAAIQQSDGVEFMGRSLRVNVAQNRNEGGGGGGGGGGFGGGGGGGGRGGYGGGRGGYGGDRGGGGGGGGGNWRDRE